MVEQYTGLVQPPLYQNAWLLIERWDNDQAQRRLSIIELLDKASNIGDLTPIFWRMAVTPIDAIAMEDTEAQAYNHVANTHPVVPPFIVDDTTYDTIHEIIRGESGKGVMIIALTRQTVIDAYLYWRQRQGE